eukprot:scpid36528/ scgid14447/ Craniofacial development protein 2; p97 bucentaur protein
MTQERVLRRRGPVCRVATFNVRSLRSNSKNTSIILDFEQYRLDVLGVTETWISGCGVDVLENGHTLYRSGGPSARAGVAVLVSKRLGTNVVSYKFISDRLVVVRMRAGPRSDSNSIVVVCSYAPTLQRSMTHPAEADAFYSSLKQVMAKVHHRDEVWILGDLNAKVGSSQPGTYSPVGHFSKHLQSNDNGERLIEFCEENDLVLTNTFFKHCMCNRSTWFADGLLHANGKPVRNKIDFIIMRRSNVLKVVDSRSYGGFVTRSDHHPVIADIKFEFWRCQHQQKSDALCFAKYNAPTSDSAVQFQNALSEKLPEFESLPMGDASAVDCAWAAFKTALHESASQAFGTCSRPQQLIKTSDPTIRTLSEQQKQLHILINRENN